MLAEAREHLEAGGHFSRPRGDGATFRVGAVPFVPGLYALVVVGADGAVEGSLTASGFAGLFGLLEQNGQLEEWRAAAPPGSVPSGAPDG